jgi:recombination protein RecT
MTVKQIENHEKRHRKGQYMTKNWRNDFNEMALKTVYRRLIGKWGVMSIEYQNKGDAMALAEQMQAENNLGFTDDISNDGDFIDGNAIDLSTGEVMEGDTNGNTQS